MRRLIVFVSALVLLPAAAVYAAELDDLLAESRDASFSAEQVISCATPDGQRDAVVNISQRDGFIKVSTRAVDGVELSAGSGGWAVSRGDDVSSASVDKATNKIVEPLYAVDRGTPIIYLGRSGTRYRLLRDGSIRADLVFDQQTGALVSSTTYGEDGQPYCVRKFIQFDTAIPEIASDPGSNDSQALTSPLETDLPDEIEGFALADVYEDPDGLTFGYYTDGFFSFAVFETTGVVALPDGSTLNLEWGSYERSFTAGQVTYVWETRVRGMALVGDLPPDLHEAVLESLPPPQDPGLLRRLWRALFG